MDNLSYLERAALNDLYGYYKMWSLTHWRIPQSDDMKDYFDVLVDKDFAIRHNIVDLSMEIQGGGFTKFIISGALWLRSLYTKYNDEYQITQTGIDYVEAHGVHTIVDAIKGSRGLK